MLSAPGTSLLWTSNVKEKSFNSLNVVEQATVPYKNEN